MGNIESWCIGRRGISGGVIDKAKHLNQSFTGGCESVDVVDVVPDKCKSSQLDSVKVFYSCCFFFLICRH